MKEQLKDLPDILYVPSAKERQLVINYELNFLKDYPEATPSDLRKVVYHQFVTLRD